MTKTLKIALVMMILCISSLYAGAGHSHSVSQSTIKKNAKIELKRLVNEKKIESTWLEAKQISAKKQGKHAKEWVIGFENLQIEKIDRQKLYIYLTPYGKIKGANYKGD